MLAQTESLTISVKVKRKKMRHSIAIILSMTGLFFLGGCGDDSKKDDVLVECKKEYAGKVSGIDLQGKVVDCMKNKKYSLSGPDWEKLASYKQN